MAPFRLLVERFPQRELDIRRRYGRDPEFRSVCADYEEAVAALRRWRSVEPKAGRKTAEYADFLKELEAEILDRLERAAAP